MNSFTILVIALVSAGITAGAMAWQYYRLAPCGNPACDIKLENPETDHLETCSHCLTGAWSLCPVNDGKHPHTTQCNDCGKRYYHCIDARLDSPNKGKSQAHQHLNGNCIQ